MIPEVSLQWQLEHLSLPDVPSTTSSQLGHQGGHWKRVFLLTVKTKL